MANVVEFNPLTNEVTAVHYSVHTPDWENKPNVVINPDAGVIKDQPRFYLKHVDGRIEQVTEEEKYQIDLLKEPTWRFKREQEYPRIEDQLDAILKQFNMMRLQGIDMNTDLDMVLGKWLAAKSKYPKPIGEIK